MNLDKDCKNLVKYSYKWEYSKFSKMADFGTKENTAICEIRHLWD